MLTSICYFTKFGLCFNTQPNFTDDAWEIIENREPRSDDKACIYVSGIPYDTRNQIEEIILFFQLSSILSAQ